MIPEADIAELKSRAEQILEQLAEVEDSFAETKANEDDQAIVKDLFASSLGRTWSALVSELDQLADWQSLERAVNQSEQFIADLHEVILSPRRRKLEERLKAWLATWSITSRPNWSKYLEDSDDEAIERLETLVEAVEEIEIQMDALKPLVTKWLSFQIKQVKLREKNVDALEEWLQYLDDVLTGAAQLDEFWNELEPAVDSEEDQTLVLIKQRWLNAWLERIVAINPEQLDHDFDGQLEVASDQWRKLKDQLNALKPILDSLVEEERLLVNHYIQEDGQELDAPFVQSLISKLSTFWESIESLQQYLRQN